MTDNFPLHRRQAEEPGSNITPQVIKSLYKIGNRVGGSKLSSQAVAEFEQAYFYPSDILEFEKLYNLPIQPIAKIIGPNDPENGYLGEATLDTEYIIGVGTNIPSWVTTNRFFVCCWCCCQQSYSHTHQGVLYWNSRFGFDHLG